MRRSLAVAAAVLMASMPLGACYLGPDPVQYAALAVTDGRPTAVVAVCGRSTVDVNVFLNDKKTTTDELHLWSVTVTVPNRVQDVEVELLGTARPGWEITSKEEVIRTGPGGFTVIPLTSFEPGHRYTLDSSAAGPEGSSAPAVAFTTDDLPKIGAGQVLAAVDHERSEVVSRDSFVNERCDEYSREGSALTSQ